MAGNTLRTQYPYAGDGLSPRPLYDYPSPTSNYPSGIGAASPAVSPLPYQNGPRFGGSAFIPPPDVFLDGRKGSVQEVGYTTPPALRARRSNLLNSDPVALHLLVETAMGDSQNFEILSVEEVESMKQEQKVLDVRLKTTKKRLESETKIRDAARSLNRLASKDDKGHRRGVSSRGSNAAKNTSARSEEELTSSNRKVDDLTREYLEIESRMRLIDMQLLMHTAAVLQLTHDGSSKRNAGFNGGQRPDSPASIYTYENNRSLRSNGDEEFDERSFYRSPDNLDNLMNALQNGTHQRNESAGRQDLALNAMSKRLEDLNERLRELIVQANPDRNQGYAPSPQAGTVPDPSSIELQLDFLDQGLRDIGAEQTAAKNDSNSSLNAMQGRLEGINNQLYAMLSRSDDKALPPPPTSSGNSEDQLNYMEDSFYMIEQFQSSLSEQINELRSESTKMKAELEEQQAAKASGDKGAQQYEATLMGLWEIIRAGEEEARQRKQERRQLLAQDPDADEEVSPDEDFNPNEEFSLAAFSAKVQMLYSRASSLKDKQSILIRQIKQQRLLNTRSDAQKEEQFDQLKERVLSARNEKASMEKELERAMEQLKQFDQQKIEADSQALRNIEARNEADSKALSDAQGRIAMLETQLKKAQDDARAEAATIEAERSELSAKTNETLAALQAVNAEKETIQADLTRKTARIEEISSLLSIASAEKEAAEARSDEATKNLKSREEELQNLEAEVVRLTTELTFAKAELDGAYGTRAERAAQNAVSPTIKKELEELAEKNTSLLADIEGLRKVADAASLSEAEARETERNLKQELSGMAADYEALTRDSIQNEKDRDALEASIDKLRDEKDALELELSEERVKWLGIRSPSVPNGGAATTMEATSIRMLREDFRKMMRDRTAEGLRALRNEQEERRKLEAVVRTMRKEATPQRSNLSKTQPLTAS